MFIYSINQKYNINKQNIKIKGKKKDNKKFQSNSNKNIVNLTDLRTNITNTYPLDSYDFKKIVSKLGQQTIYKEETIKDNQSSINYIYTSIISDEIDNKIKIYHEKNCYYGSYNGNKFGFRIFIDNDSKQLFIGRYDIKGYTGLYKLEYEIDENNSKFDTTIYNINKLSGNYYSGIYETENSKHFDFKEKSKTFNIEYDIKNNIYKIDKLQFRTYLFDPSAYELNLLSSRELINLLTNYKRICNYNDDFGINYHSLIKSRNDYKELFKNIYDINNIIFSEYLPSASSLFKTFEGCFNLTEIDITLIQGSATVFTRCFANCKKLVSVKMLENRNKCRIGGIFSGCMQLNKIDFPFLEITEAKKWNNDTHKLSDIRFPLMNNFMKV